MPRQIIPPPGYPPRPAHRPPRSPAGARISISVRVAPETAARWHRERTALGLGLGEYLDRLSQARPKA